MSDAVRRYARELESMLRNHRGVSVRLPNWGAQPFRCHYFEMMNGTEIATNDTQNRNLMGVVCPEGHAVFISKIQMAVEYWLNPTFARAATVVLDSPRDDRPIVNPPGALWSAGSFDVNFMCLTGDTSFRNAATQYLYIYNGYPVYRVPENQMMGAVDTQPQHERNGIWIDYPTVLWPGERFVIATRNAALANEPRVTIGGIRGWVVPLADLSHGQEGIMTE